jgi:hypothetical protein
VSSVAALITARVSTRSDISRSSAEAASDARARRDHERDDRDGGRGQRSALGSAPDDFTFDWSGAALVIAAVGSATSRTVATVPGSKVAVSRTSEQRVRGFGSRLTNRTPT